jgi:extracellular elastinolytic metalloproteinase
MSREIDRRDAVPTRITPAREALLHRRASEMSERMPGEQRVRIAAFDPRTGNPSSIVAEAGPAERGNYLQRALDHVRGMHDVLGFASAQPAEFSPDPHPQPTSSGAVAVHLQQRYKGIRVFQAAETVVFDPEGRLTETMGSSVTVEAERPVQPRLGVADAVLAAARHVAAPADDEAGAVDAFGEPLPLPRVDLTGFAPRVIAAFPEQAERSAVLEAGPFGDEIKAGLLWFPMDGALRLGWEVVIAMPGYQGQYRTIVDADSGEVLYCRQLVRSAVQAHVFVRDGAGARQPVAFPRPLADYPIPAPADLPTGFPDAWVTADATEGNAVRAHLGTSGPVLRGTLQGQDVVFQPVDTTDDDQKVLNIFYYNCFMHDFFYMLGFREADGNFQRSNLGRGGTGGDPVDARAHSGPVFGTANMATPADGSSPTMNMGLVASTDRHTAFDSSVVFHEFMHGVTNRLVGGALDVFALEQPQSSGMGEGWGDYVACTINGDTVVGSWVVNRPGGIRGFRYDDAFPDHFGNLGTGRYSEEHNVGEIWCAALLEVNRRIGAALAVQLVVDALKLSPANPSFLDMRDAILRALDAKLMAGQLTGDQHVAARAGIWGAFARYGMGPNARTNGASLSGVVADFTVPPATAPGGPAPVRVEASPGLAIPDAQPAGVGSVLNVTAGGRVSRMSVEVDVEHSFVGDLNIVLVGPTGRSAALHQRNGGGTRNLVRTYTSEDTAALAVFRGQPAQGAWTLQVADLAAVDTGRLRRWALALDLAAAGTAVRGEASPGLTIPDDQPAGIGSAITLAGVGTVRRIQVGVDITHTFIGDLRVELAAPSGRRAVLHDRTGQGLDNILATFDSATHGALAALVAGPEPAAGAWQLRVQDLAGQDQGKLNRWSLEVEV